jgi:hypothetical protein
LSAYQRRPAQVADRQQEGGEPGRGRRHRDPDEENARQDDLADAQHHREDHPPPMGVERFDPAHQP